MFFVLFNCFLKRVYYCSFFSLSLDEREVYPKVKVRVQGDEADQYAYEKSSLESLKAFEWLALRHFSFSDELPVSVARFPQSYAPKSPPPSFYYTKDEANKKKAVVEENQKNVRATSAPRPRAVLSSPDNDGIIGSKIQARRELLSGSKNSDLSQNRHKQSKIFPKSTSAESFAPTQGFKKELAEPRSDGRAKGRTAKADSSVRAGGHFGHRKKINPSSVQS